MAKKEILKAKVLKMTRLDKEIYRLDLESKRLCEDAKCGQFINVYLDDKSLLLPRPISIADVNDDVMTIIFQVVGKGTDLLSKVRINDEIKVSTSLGNGYDILKLNKGDSALLVGGGIGVPPLIYLAKSLKAKGVDVTCVFGFRDVAYLGDELTKLGIKVHICTDSGKCGFKGNTVEFIKANKISADEVYACGPKVMLKYLSLYMHELNKYVNVSMEERMGCGYGACVGCAIDTYDENHEVKRLKVCKDGPVFDSRKVVWDE